MNIPRPGLVRTGFCINSEGENVHMKKLIRVMFLVLCFVFVLTGCKKKQERTPDVLEMEDLRGSQPDAENPDTDGDGITDEDEKRIGTNPEKADSDRDGIPDGLELQLGLNPLSKKTDGKTQDNKRKFEQEYTAEKVKLNVSGDYKVADITFQESDGVFNIPVAVTPVYEIYMENQKFDSAEISFDYTSRNTQNVGVYQYLDDGSYKLVSEGTQAKLEHFSRYFLGQIIEDKENFQPALDIALVIDNSGSMYSQEQCAGSAENDIEFKRVDMAKSLVEKAAQTTRFSCYTFTRDITKVTGLTSDKNTLYTSINSIKDTVPKFNGTASNNAIKKALSDFEDDKTRRHYIILLSDGFDKGGLFDWDESTDSIIAKAAEKNTVIICIGLGNEIDVKHLTELATGTGGFYRYARSADDLTDLYEQINGVLNNNYVDTDGDGKTDSILLADSGFNIDTDTLPFNNIRIKDTEGVHRDGQCYGMASLTQLYYVGKLPFKYGDVKKHKYNNVPWSGSLMAKAYDFKDSKFFEKSGEYTANSVALREYSDFKHLYELLSKPAKEKWNVKDGVALFVPELRAEIEKHSELMEIYMLDESGTLNGKKYSKVEFYRYRLDNGEPQNDEDKSMYETIMAINNLYSSQTASGNNMFHFGTSGNAEVMTKLVKYLSEGVPLLIYGESHSINAVSLYRDIDNPNEYKLYCYDNNDRKQLKVLTIKRIKTSFIKDGATALETDYMYRIYDTDGVFKDEGKEINVNFDLARDLSA